MLRVGCGAIAVASVLLAASCGGNLDDDARRQLAEVGVQGALAECVLDEISAGVGGVDEFIGASDSERRKAAGAAGAACVGRVDSDVLGDVLTRTGAGLGDRAVRASFIDGMVSSGVTEDVATCITDGAVDRGLEISELMDEATISELAAACQ